VKTTGDSSAAEARPFVKWAGGKTQLIGEIEKLLPADFAKREGATYIEPFVGGGAMLLWLLQKYPDIQTAVINDINKELICTYRVVKSSVEELVSTLEGMEEEYLNLPEDGRKACYLAARERFNGGGLSDVLTAAYFIFLNRTCYNGLYRVNSKGAFNVPHGKYTNPQICNAHNLRAVSALLQRVNILCGDFRQTLEYCTSGAFFYLDPPYKPITKTSSFTSYTKDGFGDEEQIGLKKFCDEVSRRGAFFIESNSDPSEGAKRGFFDELYSGYSVKRVLASRMINSNGKARGKLSELLITNIKNK